MQGFEKKAAAVGTAKPASVALVVANGAEADGAHNKTLGGQRASTPQGLQMSGKEVQLPSDGPPSAKEPLNMSATARGKPQETDNPSGGTAVTLVAPHEDASALVAELRDVLVRQLPCAPAFLSSNDVNLKRVIVLDPPFALSAGFLAHMTTRSAFQSFYCLAKDRAGLRHLYL